MNFEEEFARVEMEQKTDGILLSDMNLSTRTYNCLRRGGYKTLLDVMLEAPNKFTQLRNFGRTSEEELYQMISFVKRATKEELRVYVDLMFHGSDLKEFNSAGKNCTVIENSLGKKVNIDTLFFRDTSGIMQEDIAIERLPLSNRTLNFCAKMKLFSLRQLASMNYYELENTQGIGEMCINEILDVFRKLTIPANVNEEARERIHNLAENICKYYHELLVEESIDDISDKMQKTLICLCIEGEKIATLEEKDCSYYLGMSPLMDVVKKRLCADASPSILVGTDFRLLCFAYGLSSEKDIIALTKAIESLGDDRRVRLIDNKIYQYKLFLSEWLDTIDGNLKQAIEYRCSGDTLEEAGTKMGLTRERVRQIISKATRKMPALYEEDYAFIIEGYGFSDEQFAKLLNLSIFQIHYLRMNHKKGNGDVQELLMNGEIPATIKDRVGKTFKDRVVIIDGECVPLKREILLERLLKEYFSEEECTTEEFEQFYLDFLSENGLAENETLLYPTSRAFEARIIDYPYSLYKLGKRIRYYNTTQIDINYLLQQVDISQYNNTEISTRKIFWDYPDVMDSYDIRDEYELHNLLRKRLDSINCVNLTVTRMPFITIGVADRFQQVDELLLQNAPITNTALAELYEERYGVQKETVLANFFVNIDIYFHDGIFDIEQKDLPESVFLDMKDRLTGDIYLWEDVKRIYQSVSNNEDEDSINAMTLKKLGYKIYSQYVISNRFSSADAYLTALLTDNNRIDINEIDVGIRRLQIFYSTLTNLRDSLDLIEIDKDIFVTFSFFCTEYCNISKEELILAGKKLIQNQNTYFSINALADSGLCDFDFGVPNNVYFLNSIIRIQDGIKTSKMGDAYVASHGEELSYLGLITFLISERGELTTYEVISSIQNEYGIKLERSRIVYVLENNSEYYYDGIFDMVCKGQQRTYSDADEFWNSEHGLRIIFGMEKEIKSAETPISKVFWKDKYSQFVELCADRFFFKMQDILKINFDELWRNSSKNGLSKNSILDVMAEFGRWAKSLKDDESSEEESIFDMFFK